MHICDKGILSSQTVYLKILDPLGNSTDIKRRKLAFWLQAYAD
jgi:hypothetical protein